MSVAACDGGGSPFSTVLSLSGLRPAQGHHSSEVDGGWMTGTLWTEMQVLTCHRQTFSSADLECVPFVRGGGGHVGALVKAGHLS